MKSDNVRHRHLQSLSAHRCPRYGNVFKKNTWRKHQRFLPSVQSYQWKYEQNLQQTFCSDLHLQLARKDGLYMDSYSPVTSCAAEISFCRDRFRAYFGYVSQRNTVYLEARCCIQITFGPWVRSPLYPLIESSVVFCTIELYTCFSVAYHNGFHRSIVVQPRCPYAYNCWSP